MGRAVYTINILIRHHQIIFGSMTNIPPHLPKLPDDQLALISKEGMEYILNHFDPSVPERNFLWTTDYKVELPVRVKKSGPGSEQPYTFAKMWKNALEKYADLAALNYESKPGQWTTLTYRQYYQQSIRFAKALISLGVKQYSAVNIIGFNSVEWAVAFHGSILGHYLPIGMYTTNGPDACEYIANHSEAEIVVMEDVSHLNKYLTVLPKVTRIKHYVIWKGTVPQNLPAQLKGKVLTWQQFMALGEKFKAEKEEDTLDYRQAAQKVGSCATFIYTSGTTGPPKAVMISHDNYMWTSEAIGKLVGMEKSDPINKGRVLSLLPLSHVAAQLLDLIVCVQFGGNLFFTDPSALQGNLVKFLQVARPTFILSVPRVWQKIEERITALASQTTGLKSKIANWAKNMAIQGTYAEVNGGPLPSGWSLAKKLVFNKIKENLGLDQCQGFYFAAAPLKQSTRLFFLRLNIYLQNVFGMSELSGPQTVTSPSTLKNFDSIESLKEAGRVMPGLELAIDRPDPEGNGQICARGRNVFMGYYKNEKETRDTIDVRGFVHSGDVGVINSKGVLTITGRIKELIITAGGENVAPVLIENEINTALPLFSQAVVVGDKRKYLGCLLVLKTKSPGVLSDEVVAYIKPKGSNATTVADAVKCPALKKIVTEGIEVANKKAISNAQRVQKFTFLPNEFSVDGGQLTPTLKIKRKIVNQKYEAQINSLYEEAKL